MSSKDYLVTKRELIASYYTSDEVEDKLKAKADNTVATQTDSGLMSGSDKAKLDGIEIGANNYTLPKADNAHLGGVKTGFSQLGRMYPIKLNEDGQGYVEVPWTDTTQTYHVVTDTQDGLMSKTDKAKLDTIEENADVSAIKAIKVNSKEVVPDNAKTVDLTDDIQDMISTAVDGKVDKEIGKTLTSNDFTDTYKEKLDGIEAHADVSPVRKLKINGKAILAGIDRTIDITDDVTNLVNSVTANKVDKETGKSLTSNDFTDELKEKLDGIATGADVAPIQTISLDGKNIPADAAKNVNLTSSVEAFITAKTTNKVDKETGKSLTSNDFTDELKSKLDGIATGADVAPIATIKVNGTNQTITDRTVDLTGAINSQITSKGYQTSQDVTSAITEAINGVTQFEYEVVTTLPASGDKGKIYLISHTHGDRDTYDEYIYVDGAFEKIGNTDVDLTNYYKKNEVYSKQETNAELEKKVTKENGKSLTTNDFTNAYKTKLDGIAASANKYSLPTASKTVKGGLRAGYKETGRNYAVNVDEAGDGYVTVPWNDTHVVVNNTLTSDSTSEALSAAQGKALKGMVDGKAASTHTHNYAGSATAGGKANSAATADSATKLSNARQINGVAFDGTGNITITANPTDNTLTNQDLNKYTNNGFYHAGGGNTCKNKPADVDAFGLMVMRTATGYCSQMLVSTQKNITYRRSYNGTAWGEWQSYYSTDHKPTPAELGAATAGHTHNYAGSSSAGGVANSAVKLANARTLTIGNTGKNFDGTANVGWTLNEIGAINRGGDHVPGRIQFGNSDQSATTVSSGCIGVLDSRSATILPNNAINQGANFYFTNKSMPTGDWWSLLHVKGWYGDTYSAWELAGTATDGNTDYRPYFRTGNNTTWNSWHALAYTTDTAPAATKLQTARTITVGGSAKSFDGTGNVNYPLKEVMNNGEIPFATWVYRNAVGEDGKGGYVKVIQLKLAGEYQDSPIVFGFHRRNDDRIMDVTILFAPSKSADPSLQGMNISGRTNPVWIHKSATSTWDVYIQKSEVWDKICIDYIYCNLTKTTYTFPNTLVTALPTSGITQASYRSWNDNAATATKLQTARSINGTNFDGTANITTTNWGTARTITIGNTGKSVNGSANVTWSLAEIGASASGHTHNYAGSSSAGGSANSAVKLTTARTINGTNFDGTANITTANWGTSRNLTVGNTAKAVNGSANVAWTLAEIGAVNKTGDTMAGNLTFNQNLQGVVWSRVTDGASIKFDCTSDESDNYLTFNVTDDEPVNFKWTKTVAGTTATLGTWKSEGIRLGKGSFIGPLSGNASTATKLQTARSFTIGNTAKSFDGSANASWSLAEIGAAAASHSHNYAGSGSAGGSANSAVKLTTARTINGTNFDGTANITTANWGTARNLTIGNTAKSVNGSANVSWSLAEIGALPTAGGTMSGVINSYKTSGTYLAGNQGHAIINSTASAGNYTMLDKLNSTNGYYTDGVWEDKRMFFYTAKSTVDAGSNSTTKQLTLLNEAGNSTFPGTVTAPTFSGSLSGNAATATKLQTARTIALNGDIFGSGTFDGTGNLTITTRKPYSTIAVSNTNNYKYHRFAYSASITSSFYDMGDVFIINRGYTGGGYGIFQAIVRTKGSTDASSCKIVWLARSADMPVDCIQAGFNKTYGKTTCDLYYVSSGSYNGATIQRLHQGGRGSFASAFTMINSTEAGDTTASDKKGSVESYTSTSDGASKLNRAITDTITAIDYGISAVALKATILETTRTINGTNFNGSANITTANWGTARNLTIGNTAKSVNGSANVSWSLAEIGAAAASHSHNYAGSGSAGGSANSAVKLTTARSINGTNFDGTANITTTNWGTARTITIGNTGKSVNGSANVAWTLAEIGAAAASHSHNYAGSGSAGGAANSSNVLNSNARMDYGWNGVNYFNINASAGNDAKVNDTPNGDWWHILRFNHGNASGYYTDLAIPFNKNGIYYKRITGGTVQNGGWVPVLDSLNYFNYIDSTKLPRLDGSGTNYNTAGVDGRFKVCHVSTGATNPPTNHEYNLWTSRAADTKLGAQLALGMTNEAMYYRKKQDGSWGSWNNVLTERTFSTGTASPTTERAYDAGSSRLYFTNSEKKIMAGIYASGTASLSISGGAKTSSINFLISSMDAPSSILNQKGPYTPVTINKDGLTGTIKSSSDYRLKKDIKTTKLNALSEIKEWDFKEFNWIRDNKHENVGLIAQQIKDISPSAVLEGFDGTYELSQNNLLMYALKAIQELQAEIEELKYPDGNAPRKARRATWTDDMTLEEKLEFIEELDAKRGLRKEQEPKETIE